MISRVLPLALAAMVAAAAQAQQSPTPSLTVEQAVQIGLENSKMLDLETRQAADLRWAQGRELRGGQCLEPPEHQGHRGLYPGLGHTAVQYHSAVHDPRDPQLVRPLADDT